MMLPTSLRQWASILELLPEDIASGLAGWLHPLDNLLGRVEDMPLASQGELDGYDGLARRGPAERMLTSEWLLATEVPDEWSRRAAEGELAYLNPNFRRPQTHSITAALFDCGPDVLGTPRLAQLAALLVLARRARAAGAEFLWGVLQSPITEVRRDITAQNISWLLQQHAPLPPSAPEVECWLQEFAEAGDTFLVGGESLGHIHLPAGAILVIEDPFQDETEFGRVLHLRAHRFPSGSRGPDRELKLPLPPDDWCTRVLENPAAMERPPGVRLRRCSRATAIRPEMMWLSPSMLVARSRQDEGNLVIYRMPHSDHGALSRPKLHRLIWGEETNYVGAVGACVLVGRRVEAGIEVFPLTGRAPKVPAGTFVCSPEPTFDLVAGTQTLRPLVSLGRDSQLFAELYPNTVSMLVTDNSPSVPSTPDHTTQAVAARVLAWSPGNAALRCLRSLSYVDISLVTGDGRHTEFAAPDQMSEYLQGGRALWGPVIGQGLATGAAVWSDSVLALAHAAGAWTVWYQAGEVLENCVIGPSRRVEVDGVAFVRGGWTTPALICRCDGGRTMELRGCGWSRVLGREACPILGAVQHPYSPLLAWCTASELVVYSLTVGAEVARWDWGSTA